ncbi:hypothetical protein GCM10027298_38520 [Epidermidibacterium keratini]
MGHDPNTGRLTEFPDRGEFRSQGHVGTKITGHRASNEKYLKYRLLAANESSAQYEIATRPQDPTPIRVEVSTAQDAASQQVSGPQVAANKAIRQILQRRTAEQTWPKGGVIHS